MDALLRRRMMFQQGGGGADVFPFGYITDGLVLMLDGIDKGSVQDAWENLTGNHSYYLFDNKVTVESNAVVTNGTDIIVPSADQSVIALDGTIELCGEALDNSQHGIIMSGVEDGNLIGVYYYKNEGFAFGTGHSSPANYQNVWNFGSIDQSTPFSVSLNDDRALFNASIDGVSRFNDKWAGTNQAIGGRPLRTDYRIMFRIHSIRIYNRKLSRAEMLHNQLVDNNRFNLGLII